MPALFLFSVAAFVSTLCGGIFAMRCARWMNYVLSLVAGILLGLICFELLPEIAEGAETAGIALSRALVPMVGGFLFFHVMEKFVLLHHAHEDVYAPHRHPHLGLFSAAALVGHSFLDGVALGLGFQVSGATGIAVGLAVISHDFCDGLNTVSLMLSHGANRKRAWVMLALDAIAPALGAAATFVIPMPEGALLSILAFFAGFLLYISAADILPQAHSKATPRRALVLVALTALGATLMFFVAQGHVHAGHEAHHGGIVHQD